MRTLANLVLFGALGLTLAGCGGSTEVGDAVVVPPSAPGSEKPADAPADKADVGAQPDETPKAP